MRDGLKEEGSSERTRSVGWLCAAAAAPPLCTAQQHSLHLSLFPFISCISQMVFGAATPAAAVCLSEARCTEGRPKVPQAPSSP